VEEDMKKKTLIILGIVVVLVSTFMIGIVAGGGIVYSWLHEVQPAYAAQSTQPDPEAGLIVTSVEKDGPASKAGIVRGDILQSINGHEVNSMADVSDIMQDLEAGDDVLLTVLHGDELRSLNATVAEGNSGIMLGLSLCCGKAIPIIIEPTNLIDGKPLIIRVQKESPAEKAGLEPGDMILSIDGDEIDSGKSLSEWIGQYEPGDQIQLEVRNLRDKETRSISIELGEHPEREGRAYLGVQVIQMPQVLDSSEKVRPFHGFEFEFHPIDEEGFSLRIHPRDRWDQPLTESGLIKGIIIGKVIEDSPASTAGLEEGDVITALNGEDIQGPKSFADTISGMDPEDEISLTIYRSSENEVLEIEVKLGEHPETPEAGYLGVYIRGTLRLGAFDGEYRFEHWLPFLDQFRMPFHFQEKFHLLEL
jgi:S1-C subfamily serine protease